MNLIDLISKHPVPVTRFQRPYVIAEAGVNHEGSMDTARRLIDEAALGGADAIKFQTYKAGTLASKHSPAYWDTSKEPTPSQYELFKKHDSFWKGEFENLKKHCDQAGIAFMSTPFDVESAKFLNDMMDVFKISSSDLTNRPFIEFMCDFKKPIIMSTGAASLAEIAEAVSWIEAKGNPLARRADRSQRVIADVLPDDPCISQIIELLQYVSQHKRHGERPQSAGYAARGKIPVFLHFIFLYVWSQ